VIERLPSLEPGAVTEADLSRLSRGLIGSEVLRIAAEIRALAAQGRAICNLTVGDFDSREFRPPGAARRRAPGAP
jgi:aspartate aminotransferase